MKKAKIIDKIATGEPLFRSEELLSWIQQSDENQNEYIRYKNLWAILQQGKEMDPKYITEDYKLVKQQIVKSGSNTFNFPGFVKYAAIIILAIAFGYYINSISGNNEVSINEISVPNGNRSLIVLPDGSKAWLTNGSKLFYPETFAGGKTRSVKLEGEAYFFVSHNKKKPFIVDLGEQRVKVLGTEFSVIAYPDDNTVQVDLVNGKVQLDVYNGKDVDNYKSYILNPLHSLVLDKTSGKLENIEIPDSFYKYWQEGIYEFKNESFASLARKIERIYSVEVIFEDTDLMKNTFTGAFFIDSNIYTIIETFKRASRTPFDYSIDKNKIYIKNKTKN